MDLAFITKVLGSRRESLDELGVEKLAVFGSTSRGERRPDSDVDILVVFNRPSTLDRYMSLKFLLEELLGRRVDLVTQKALCPELRERILSEAIQVA